MPVQKIDPKVIFASDAPIIDKPPVFSDKTKGWDVSRANDGRPQIKEMNKVQQDTDLKILWLNENAVLPFDASIDYPDGSVALKDGSFKQLVSGAWVEFLDDFASKDEVKRGIANRYDPLLTYNLGERVVLTNGDIVRSTIDGNTNNPNTDMTGWKKADSIVTVESISQLRLINNAKEGDLVYVRGYHAPTNFLLAQPYDGGGVFIWAGGSTVTPVQGIVEQATGVTTGRFLRQFDDNVVNVLFCGAKRDGVTETNAELKIALQFAINNNMPCYAPSGTYLLGNRVDPTFPDKSSLVFYGDGFGKTMFKERDGLTAQIGRYNMSFYFLVTTNKTVENMVFRDFTIDKNGHTSMLTPEVIASSGLYAYEQAHCLGISGQGTTGIIKNVLVENVRTLDKVGGGVVFMAGQIDKVIINNIGGENWQHNGGQRGDFEFQSTIGNLKVNDSYGNYAQCEPDVTTPHGGINPIAEFTNCNYASTEFTAYSAAPTAQLVVMNNHIAPTKMTLRNTKAIVNDSNFAVSAAASEYWSSMAKGSILTNCNIVVKTNTDTNTTSPFYVRSSINSNPTYLTVRGGTIVPDSNFVPDVTTGFAVQNTTYNTLDQVLHLEDVEFSPLFERSVDCYANGKTTIKNCKLASRATKYAVRAGSFSTFKSDVILDGNDLGQLSGGYVEFLASNTLWTLNFKGVHDFAKSGFSSNNLPNTELCAKADGYFTSAIVPTGKGILGWRVKIEKPVFGYGSEFIGTATHATASTYRLSQQNGVKLDTTPNRPTSLTTASCGLRYLDTTLAAGGKPITYNGSAWVDSVGVVV